MPGRPAEDDPRRCKAVRRSGERCRRWAMRDSDYCPFHGGRNRKRLKRGVPRFYSAFLGTTLRRAVSRSLRQSPALQFSLNEELALSRHVCGQAIALYSAAVETGKAEVIASASMVMRDALEHVRSMCESASRVALAGEDRISVHNLSFVVNQVVTVVYKVLGDEGAEEAHLIAQALQDELLVDDGRPVGTTLTPDADVADMIDTVPDAGATAQLDRVRPHGNGEAGG